MSTAVMVPFVVPVSETITQHVIPPTPVASSTSPRPSICSPPYKRLRSCLSPSRSSSPQPASGASTPGCNSRSTSFSSATSGHGHVWKRTKSVRWEGENEGFPVTSYHNTYSATEYDRTPLAAPSEQERACVLPARNSRCFGSSYNCFLPNDPSDEVESPVDARINRPVFEPESSPLSSPCLMAFDQALNSSLADISADSIDLNTPLGGSDTEDDEANDKFKSEEDEDREWEECAERRRMMFARMCNRFTGNGGSSGDSPDEAINPYPEFEGYQSVYSRIHEVMKNAGCNFEYSQEGTPMERDEDDIEDGQPVVRRMSVENLKLVEDIDPLSVFTRQEETPSLVSLSTDSSDEVISSPLTSSRPSVDEAATKVDGSVTPVKPSGGLGFGLGMERTTRYELED